jgi:hypothetical protein
VELLRSVCVCVGRGGVCFSTQTVKGGFSLMIASFGGYDLAKNGLASGGGFPIFASQP